MIAYHAHLTLDNTHKTRNIYDVCHPIQKQIASKFSAKRKQNNIEIYNSSYKTVFDKVRPREQDC